MADDLLRAIRKRRFAREWLEVALHEDNELPDDEELVEMLHEELTRQWQRLWLFAVPKSWPVIRSPRKRTS